MLHGNCFRSITWIQNCSSSGKQKNINCSCTTVK